MLLLVDICQGINPTRALALFGESVKGNNVDCGWEVPKLSKLFAKIVTKKTSINDFGIRSFWYGHNKMGHNKAMWIHHFFVMQFVHPKVMLFPGNLYLVVLNSLFQLLTYDIDIVRIKTLNNIG